MPSLRNTHDSWGWIAIVLHWVTAISVLGLYTLGTYMTDLSYYDPWYQSAPFWHKSIGLLLCFWVLIRILWRTLDKPPQHLETIPKWQRNIASAVHVALYSLLLLVFASGYLISTADGRAISFFGLFEVPAWISGIENQEDRAGEVHFWATNTLVTVAVIHAFAALKHHVIDRDVTLLRMLGLNKKN